MPLGAVGFLLLIVASLCYHIVYVISLCTQEQVVKTNADWVITVVKNLHSLGNRAI